MYTFAYTYAGSCFESPVFIGWFESSTGPQKKITASVAVFFRPKERADRKNGRQIRTADS